MVEFKKGKYPQVKKPFVMREIKANCGIDPLKILSEVKILKELEHKNTIKYLDVSL